MTENEFMLADRIAKIQSINQQFNLENNAYLSFSGGKDSTVLHYLLDEAIPGNKIPRVFINTGIEYKDIYICKTNGENRRKVCYIFSRRKYNSNAERRRISF